MEESTEMCACMIEILGNARPLFLALSIALGLISAELDTGKELRDRRKKQVVCTANAVLRTASRYNRAHIALTVVRKTRKS
jgi:hypothetical protein